MPVIYQLTSRPCSEANDPYEYEYQFFLSQDSAVIHLHKKMIKAIKTLKLKEADSILWREHELKFCKLLLKNSSSDKKVWEAYLKMQSIFNEIIEDYSLHDIIFFLEKKPAIK